MALRIYMTPPPEELAKQEAAKAAAKLENEADAEKTGSEKPTENKVSEAIADAAAAVESIAAAEPEAPKAPRVRMTIGSADPSKSNPYGLLITLDSMGASVERAELSSEAYRDIEEFGGYLGHLSLTSVKNGLKLGVVGKGTPADLATCEEKNVSGGLAAEDVLLSVNDQNFALPIDLQQYLKEKTKAGESVTLKVERVVAGTPTSLSFTTKLFRHPVSILHPENHSYVRKDRSSVVYPSPDAHSFLLKLDRAQGVSASKGDEEISTLPSLQSMNWEVVKSTIDSVEFAADVNPAAFAKIGKTGDLRVIKRYRLAPQEGDHSDRYLLKLEVELQNKAKEPVELSYRLDGPNGLPLEGWWYSTKLHPEMWKVAGARDVVWRLKGKSHHLVSASTVHAEAVKARKDKKSTDYSLLENAVASEVDYAAVDSQFFAVAMKPISNEEKPLVFRDLSARPAESHFDLLDAKRVKTMNNTFQFGTETLKIAGSESLKHEYDVFMGPKKADLLDRHGLSSLIEYGWTFAALPAKALGLLLHTLYMLVGNYGIAIILMTVIVRGCMLPLSLKQARSTAMMQQLQPEIAKLKEKFKDNAEKLNAATWELYKKYNFNPFGGCLLVFIQLPIFIGLYRCLSVDIDLRDADLIPGMQWCTNLAGPDGLFYWKHLVWPMIGDEADGWFGPYFNILPLFTCALFIVQQKMFTPPPTDEQSEMQQKMMMFMTVFMGVMFFKVPAGLCLYFITSSLWGIAERKLLKLPQITGANKPLVPVTRKSGR